jgi:hypothetical protein
MMLMSGEFGGQGRVSSRFSSIQAWATGDVSALVTLQFLEGAQLQEIVEPPALAPLVKFSYSIH